MVPVMAYYFMFKLTMTYPPFPGKLFLRSICSFHQIPTVQKAIHTSSTPRLNGFPLEEVFRALNAGHFEGGRHFVLEAVPL